MTLALIAGIFIAIGFFVAFGSLSSYSNFLARLQLVDRSSVEKMGMEAGDRWSKKNIEIGLYFWRQGYLAIADQELQRLGRSVRATGMSAACLVCGGIILLVVGDLLGK